MVVQKVGGGRSHCLVTASAKLVELPHGPINTPLPVKVNTHTPHFGDSTCKALLISVVALLGEWRGSEGRRASRPIGSPPRSSSVEALPESFEVQQDFSALVCSSAKDLSESYGF
jgi:hypothetical protein